MISRKVMEMDFNIYQFRANKTAIYPKEKALEYLCLGLVSEAGEVAGKIKKLIRDHNSELTPDFADQISLEVGDVLWYIAQLSTELKMNMGKIASENIEKLSKRSAKNKLGGDGDNR